MNTTVYDYRQNIKDDIYQLFYDGDYTSEILEQGESYLLDELFCDDSVTGNASGSYFFNRENARDALYGNEEFLSDAFTDFGYGAETLEDPETCDVLVRCYLLSECLSDIFDDLVEEFGVEE